MTQRTMEVSKVAVMLVLAACSPDSLKQVAQQRAGDFVITVLSDGGLLKKGSNVIVVEFQSVADKQLKDPGNVRIQPYMAMAGSSHMVAKSETKPGREAGQFSVTTELAMAGKWKLHVAFGKDQQVDVDVNAQ